MAMKIYLDGTKLRRRREELLITRQELSQKTGLSNSYLTKLELDDQGRRALGFDADNIDMLAAPLKMSAAEFRAEIVRKSPPPLQTKGVNVRLAVADHETLTDEARRLGVTARVVLRRLAEAWLAEPPAERAVILEDGEASGAAGRGGATRRLSARRRPGRR